MNDIVFGGDLGPRVWADIPLSTLVKHKVWWLVRARRAEDLSVSDAFAIFFDPDSTYQTAAMAFQQLKRKTALPKKLTFNVSEEDTLRELLYPVVAYFEWVSSIHRLPGSLVHTIIVFFIRAGFTDKLMKHFVEGRSAYPRAHWAKQDVWCRLWSSAVTFDNVELARGLINNGIPPTWIKKDVIPKMGPELASLLLPQFEGGPELIWVGIRHGMDFAPVFHALDRTEKKGVIAQMVDRGMVDLLEKFVQADPIAFDLIRETWMDTKDPPRQCVYLRLALCKFGRDVTSVIRDAGGIHMNDNDTNVGLSATKLAFVFSKSRHLFGKALLRLAPRDWEDAIMAVFVRQSFALVTSLWDDRYATSTLAFRAVAGSKCHYATPYYNCMQRFSYKLWWSAALHPTNKAFNEGLLRCREEAKALGWGVSLSAPEPYLVESSRDGEEVVSEAFIDAPEFEVSDSGELVSVDHSPSPLPPLPTKCHPPTKSTGLPSLDESCGELMSVRQREERSRKKIRRRVRRKRKKSIVSNE
jgi:hypothetical protein